MVKEARDITTKGYGTSFNRRSGEDGYSNNISSAEGRRYIKKPLCYGCRQEGE